MTLSHAGVFRPSYKKAGCALAIAYWNYMIFPVEIYVWYSTVFYNERNSLTWYMHNPRLKLVIKLAVL